MIKRVFKRFVEYLTALLVVLGITFIGLVYSIDVVQEIHFADGDLDRLTGATGDSYNISADGGLSSKFLSFERRILADELEIQDEITLTGRTLIPYYSNLRELLDHYTENWNGENHYKAMKLVHKFKPRMGLEAKMIRSYVLQWQEKRWITPDELTTLLEMHVERCSVIFDNETRILSNDYISMKSMADGIYPDGDSDFEYRVRVLWYGYFRSYTFEDELNHAFALFENGDYAGLLEYNKDFHDQYCPDHHYNPWSNAAMTAMDSIRGCLGALHEHGNHN